MYGFINEFRDWNLDLIVNPTSKLLILIITIVFILLVILGFIIYLHYKEVVRNTNKLSKKIRIRMSRYSLCGIDRFLININNYFKMLIERS